MAAGANSKDQVEISKGSRKQESSTVELLRKLEVGLVPDDDIRSLFRLQLVKRLKWGYKPTYDQQLAQLLQVTKSLRHMNMALEMDALDEKVYEVPMSFLKLMFGATIKESCCYFEDESTTLDEAEIAMLDLCCERAQIKDGHSVLDIGCGQGALALHVAQKFKKCRVTAVTNSLSQKEYIEEQARNLNLTNVEAILADVTKHEMEDRFDRILAIEFFEHMKNYELLLRKISNWMTDDGLLFIDHVCHKAFAYHFESIDEDDGWYTEYIFPAGTLFVPSASFFLYFQDDVTVLDHWTVSGMHFYRTLEEWLKKLDANKDAVKAVMKEFSGSEEGAVKWTNYWRGFCLHGMEMFGYNNGDEWMLSHLLFKKK